jgi:serine/threonine protein kinase
MEESRVLNNRYQLLEPLGKGGMAVVYRARDLMLERLVAVKVLREDYSSDPAFQDRFRQEAKAVANLSHPNIVTMHDFGIDKGQIFLVMEYVPGTDLKTLIKQHGRFIPEEAVPLLVQACAGIGYAHRAGLVHCDVKPQNMLVTPDMRLKVADFGIARALSTIHPDEKSDVVWGSPQYFAPEQASGAAPSPASDVYSLGIIMYEMLAGALPFQATTAVELARQHVEEEPPLLSEKIPGISPMLEQILAKVLSKEPSQRYRTADQLGRVLLNFGNARSAPALALTPEAAPVLDETIPAEKTTTGQPPVSTIDWASVGLGLVALVAVLGLIPFWMWIYFVYNPPIR